MVGMTCALWMCSDHIQRVFLGARRPHAFRDAGLPTCVQVKPQCMLGDPHWVKFKNDKVQLVLSFSTINYSNLGLITFKKPWKLRKKGPWKQQCLKLNLSSFISTKHLSSASSPTQVTFKKFEASNVSHNSDWRLNLEMGENLTKWPWRKGEQCKLIFLTKMLKRI